MTRPTERFAKVEAAGEIAEDRGAFWVRSPWSYPPDRNLSAFEPNQVLLNTGDFRFLNISYISGAGVTGDGRGVLIADVDDDLSPDLIVRQAGGGPVRIFANRFPKAARLTVSLEGTKSNRLGIGARVEVHVGTRRVVRQLWSHNNFLAQQAPRVRFGLKDAKIVDTVTVSWPSGGVQRHENVPVNKHIRIREGAATFDVLGSAE